MNTIFINPNGKSLTGSSKWHRYRKEENMGVIQESVWERYVHITRLSAKKVLAPAMGKEKQ